MAVSDIISGLGGAFGGALSGYLGGQAVKEQVGDLKDISREAQTAITGAGQQAADSLEFKPFTVTSGLGNVGINNQTGQIDLGLSQQGQQLQDTLLGQAQSMAGQAPVTQESLYAQLQAAQAPELERQRASQEARLRAQGRLGLSSSAYGGSPEQLAFEKAAQEASAANFFQAAQLAPQLQGQNFQNVAQALSAGYVPQSQLQGLLNPAATFSQLGQAAQTAQSDALLESIIQGQGIRTTSAVEAAKIQAQQAESEAKAYGGLFGALATPAIAFGANKLGLVGNAAGDVAGNVIDSVTG